MKNKSLMMLMVAAGCGLVAMIGVQQMMSGSKSGAKTRILVARTEIDVGVELDKTNVGFKEWPSDAIPEGAIRTEEEFTERALKHRVVPGQPILSTELGGKGEFGPEIQIPSDMRLVTIPTTVTMTHSGLLRPGNHVDVSAVIELPVKGGGKRIEVKPVLQCIKVFAVDSRTVNSEESKDPKAKDAKNVTFLVYPLQAQLLQLAYKQSNGGLQFALRSGSDKNLVNAQDLSDQSLSMLSNSLLGYQTDGEKPAQEKKPAPTKSQSAFKSYLAPETSNSVTSVGDQAVRRTWKIEIFQGDQREVQEIEWPEEAAPKTKRTSTESASPWANPLMKFFDRRQKAEQASPVEAQSTSLLHRRNAADSPAGETEGSRRDKSSDGP
jgi:pilus assembly protein CpaB